MGVNSYILKMQGSSPPFLSQDLLPPSHPNSLPPLRLFHPCQECKQVLSSKKPSSLCPAVSLIQKPPSPPLPSLYYPSVLHFSGWGGCSAVLKLWMDIWAAGFSRSCCPELSQVIGSAWLINGGHCRWMPFSPQTDTTYCSTLSLPISKTDYISVCSRGRTIFPLLFHCLNFTHRFFSVHPLLLRGLLFSFNLTGKYLFIAKVIDCSFSVLLTVTKNKIWVINE